MLCYVIYAYVKSKYLDYTVIFKPYSNHRFTCYAGQQRLHGIMSAVSTACKSQSVHCESSAIAMMHSHYVRIITSSMRTSILHICTVVTDE